MYFILIETEGRSLEEIELHFSDSNRKLCDINIQKIPRVNFKLDEIEGELKEEETKDAV